MTYQISPTINLSEVSLGDNDYVRSVLQNVLAILKTRQGSIPMYREFGLPMKFLDKPIAIAQQICVTEVREAVAAFEPRAEVVNILFDDSNAVHGIMTPVVEVNIL